MTRNPSGVSKEVKDVRTNHKERQKVLHQSDRYRDSCRQPRKIWKEHKGWGTRSGYTDHNGRNFGVHERPHGPMIAHPGPLASLKKLPADDIDEGEVLQVSTAEPSRTESIDRIASTYLVTDTSPLREMSVWDTAEVKMVRARRRPEIDSHLSPSTIPDDITDIISELALDYDIDPADLLNEQYAAFAALSASQDYDRHGREYDFENDSFVLDWQSDVGDGEEDWEDLCADAGVSSGPVKEDRPTYAQMTKVEVT